MKFSGSNFLTEPIASSNTHSFDKLVLTLVGLRIELRTKNSPVGEWEMQSTSVKRKMENMRSSFNKVTRCMPLL